MNAPFVLAAGGTGGHLFPAQALAGELMRRGRRVVVMTDGRGHNYGNAFPGAEIATVPAATFAGRSGLGRIAAFGVIARTSRIRNCERPCIGTQSGAFGRKYRNPRSWLTRTRV